MTAEEPEPQAETAAEPSAEKDWLKVAKKELDTLEMVSRITPGNRHGEWDLGPPQGKEVW
ncbi:MAG: hypothetical protein F4X66_03825 [Chloroflexi bacterium]|nr:hypothetical protein [Chloroflexota bacterium]MYE41814.1 hypothetical protein [Chloroflexota bacterium]